MSFLAVPGSTPPATVDAPPAVPSDRVKFARLVEVLQPPLTVDIASCTNEHRRGGRHLQVRQARSAGPSPVSKVNSRMLSPDSVPPTKSFRKVHVYLVVALIWQHLRTHRCVDTEHIPSTSYASSKPHFFRGKVRRWCLEASVNGIYNASATLPEGTCFKRSNSTRGGALWWQTRSSASHSSTRTHTTTIASSSSLLLSSLELSDTQSLRALNTNPPRNRCTSL